MGTLKEKLEYIADTKDAIKDAIEAKGVTVASTATFRSYADSIDEIETGGGSGDLFEIEESVQLLEISSVNRTYTITKPGFYLVGLICERRSPVTANDITGNFTTLYNYTGFLSYCVKIISVNANTTITYSTTMDYGGNRAKCFCLKINLELTSVNELYSTYSCNTSGNDNRIEYNPSSLVVTGQKALIMQIANFDGNAGDAIIRFPAGLPCVYIPLFWHEYIDYNENWHYGNSYGQIAITSLDSLSNVTYTLTNGTNWGSTGLIILDLI